jgi:hypothetical protein
VKVYIILPSTIYGIATGKLVELGIQNPHSIQIPSLINASLARGQGGMVGLGKNIWPNVHVGDRTRLLPYKYQYASLKLCIVADLYIVLFNGIKSNPLVGHGREGYYFGENGEHTLYDIGKAISQALVEVGRGKHSEPTTLTEEEGNKYFGVCRNIHWRWTSADIKRLFVVEPCLRLRYQFSLSRQPVPLHWLEAH